MKYSAGPFSSHRQRRRALHPGHDRARPGNDAASIEHFSNAVKFEPGLVDAYRGLALAHFRTGQPGAAKEAVRRGLAVHPDSAELHLILGNLLGGEQDHAGRGERYNAGLAVQPDSPELHNNSATRCAAWTCRCRHRELFTAVDLRPGFDDARLNLANALRSEAASRRRSLTSSPCSRRIRTRSRPASGPPESSKCRNRASDALRLLQPALARAPNEPNAAVRRGHRQGEAEPARGRDRGISSGSRSDAKFVGAHIELGNAYLQAGRSRTAARGAQASPGARPGASAGHMVAALSGTTSERASEKYVATLFDWYAEQFDSHLVQALKYNMPEQIAAKLRSVEHPRGGTGAFWTGVRHGSGRHRDRRGRDASRRRRPLGEDAGQGQRAEPGTRGSFAPTWTR